MKNKKIILLILALVLLVGSLFSFTSCSSSTTGCKDAFVDENDDGYCDKCKHRIAPCTELGENHGIIETGNVCKTCKFSLSECLKHEDYLHDDNLCDRCGAYCTSWDEFVGMFKVFHNEFITNGGYKETFEGLGITALIAVFGLLIGIVIGILIAVVKVMPKTSGVMKILSVICDIYVGFFRGTPMVVQLLLGYFVLLPSIGISTMPEIVAIVIFGLNSGAYVSEIMRAGINSVDRGQLEAGRAVGLPYGVAMMKIIIPQSIKNILPTLGNEFIVLVKETSIVSFITVVDITKALKNIADATYEYIIPYVVLALIYLVLVILITIGVKCMERRLKRDERKA